MKTYQLPKYEGFGTILKIAPVTTEEQTNTDTCLQVNGTDKMKIYTQTVLPLLDDFKNIGKEHVFNGAFNINEMYGNFST